MQAIIGMSPWNSYFQDKAVAFLLRETIKKHRHVAIMVADVPAVSTYMAMGYQIPEATKKARLQWNWLKNRTKRVLAEMGLDPNAVTIIDWANEVEIHPNYQVARDNIQNLYEQNPRFQQSVDATSLVVLKNSWKEYDGEAVKKAVHYLLSEIAFLEFAPDFFHQEKIAYFYHKNWEVFEDYVAGNFDGIRKPYLEFVLLEAPYETYHNYTDSLKSRRDLICEKGVITCGYIPYFHYFIVDAYGKPTGGVFYEIITQLGVRHNLRVEFVEQVWYGAIAWRLNAGFIDVFACPTWPSEDRRLELFFSSSLFSTDVFAFIDKNSSYAQREIIDMQNDHFLRVAVKEHDIHHELAKEYFPHATLVRVPQLSHIQEVIAFVLDHKADVTFRDPELVKLYLQEWKHDMSVLVQKGLAGNPVASYENCFALPRGEFELKRMIDECLPE